MLPLWAKSSRGFINCRMSDSSNIWYLQSVFTINSCDNRMSSTFSRPRYCCMSASSMESFFCCKVSVRSAWMILAWILKVLSSHIMPDGMSMLTTLAGLWLMYFTMAAKPPANGLLRPLPKRPSTTRVPSVNCGGSKLTVISVKCLMLLHSVSLFLLGAQSAESLLCTLKR